jgi:hypothetical protein
MKTPEDEAFEEIERIQRTRTRWVPAKKPQDEIIELAKQAGFERLGHTDEDWVCYPEDIERFAKLVAAKERKEWEKEFAGMGEWACVHLLEERNKA